MHKLLSLFFIIFFAQITFSQELNCDVRVTYENVSQNDPSIFRNLEEKIRNFLNETVWTNDNFAEEERIDCSCYLNIINETDMNRFEATATIKSSRPVYNSTYNSVVLDIIDKDFEFEYDPYTVLEYRENDFANNLTSSLAFYALTMIGLDYDSFQMNGGNLYHQKAQQIVQNATSAPFPGWTQSNTNNGGNLSKFWLSNNLTENRYTVFKTQFYNYHRQGLDQLYDEPREAWQSIENVINSLAKFQEQNRNLPIMYAFFDAKAEEIVNVMSKAQTSQKLKMSEQLQELDPINSKLYKSLQK